MLSPACPDVIHRFIPSLCVPVVPPLTRLPTLVPHRADGVMTCGAVTCGAVVIDVISPTALAA